MVLVVLIVLVVLVVLAISVFRYSGGNKDFRTNTIKTLLRQAGRWSAAASQDESPIVALLHANYGAGYLWALKDIATDNEIKRVGGVDIIKLKNKITEIQDSATRKVSAICPQFIGNIDEYLLRIGGDL